MPNITNPSAIPATKRAAFKKVARTVGPQVLGDRYPTDADGQPRTDLTDEEVDVVVEQVTREFWRQQLEAVEANEAAEAARKKAVEANRADPFA